MNNQKDVATAAEAGDGAEMSAAEALARATEAADAAAPEAPAEAKAVLVDAFNKAMATDKVKTWAKENYYLLSGKTGAESKAVFDALESNFAWTLWELGAATVDPASLGIPKP